MTNTLFRENSKNYLKQLQDSFTDVNLSIIEELTNDIKKVWEKEKKIFLYGNGGSAANAIHIANDLFYGVGVSKSGQNVPGINVDALPSNQGILTCLANDISYDDIYSEQLKVKGSSGDLIIVLSGSGNSKNIVKALSTSKTMGIKSYAILGYNGGKCKSLADKVIHFKINDMQIAEDTQLIVGHLCMQWLCKNKPNK